jgi:hypothetical protein
MAEKRMVSKNIIDSDDFLDMSLSTQALYFHLLTRADDEGFINNVKKIMRMINCNEDDLKVLVFKNYLIPFESGVVVVKHWYIHNYIRADRLKPTFHKVERSSLDVVDKVYLEKKGLNCPTSDRQLEDNCRRSIDKYSIDKYSIDKSILYENDGQFKQEFPKINHLLIMDLYNQTCVNLTKIKQLTASRVKTLDVWLLKSKNYIEEVKELFTIVSKSSFLNGESGWRATFDWIIKPANRIKIIEGNYNNDNKKQLQQKKPSQTTNYTQRQYDDDEFNLYDNEAYYKKIRKDNAK